MAKDDKKKKPKNLDELMDGLKEEHSKNLDESFKAWDAFTKDENQLHLYNNIFTPAQQSLYNGIKEELDKIFESDDTAKVYNKEKEVKKAVVAGLKKYFEKTHPAVVKAMDDLEMDEDEQYAHLVQQYDSHVGAGNKDRRGREITGLGNLVSLIKDRKSTVGHVKKTLSQLTENHTEGAINHLQNKYLNHHFSKYHTVEVASYLKPKLEKAGYEIEDKARFMNDSLPDLIDLRNQHIEKKGHPYLKKKEEDDKKK